MILIIDNYDSFTYNLFQAIAELGVEAKVVRNDQISLAEIEKLAPKGIILSPGPGRPEESGICLEILKDPKVPVLGVCLGHQAIGLMYFRLRLFNPDRILAWLEPIFRPLLSR